MPWWDSRISSLGSSSIRQPPDAPHPGQPLMRKATPISCVETTQHRALVQSDGGHQELETLNRAADLAAGPAELDRPLPQICRGGEHGQGGEGASS